MKRLLKIILPLSIVSLLIVASVALWSVQTLENALKVEKEALILQDIVADLSRQLQTAESAQRGYLLTNNNEYLVSYTQALPRIPRILKRLKNLVSDNPQETKIAEKIDRLITQKLEEMRPDTAHPENHQFKSDSGQTLMIDIFGLLSRLDHRAELDAVHHEGFIRRYSNVLKFSILGGSLITLILVIIFANLSRKEIKNRKINEESLRTAEQAAVTASQMKSRFLSTISHEIRTPLNGIIGMNDVLRSRLRSQQHLAEFSHYTDVIHQSGLALLRIVNDILDFSKIEAGKVTYELTKFSTLELVESSAELFSAKASEKNISIATYVDPAIPVNLIGDSSRIAQVLRNLISNAVKFTETGGVVITAINRLEAGSKVIVRYEVSDTGIGIPAAEEGHLFEAFYQLRQQGGKTHDGTGLGLSISKGIVELLSGELGYLAQKKDQGSIFWFEVPLSCENREHPILIPNLSSNTFQQITLLSKNPVLKQVFSYYAKEFPLVDHSASPNCDEPLASPETTLYLSVQGEESVEANNTLDQSSPDQVRYLRLPFTRLDLQTALNQATSKQAVDPTLTDKGVKPNMAADFASQAAKKILIVEDNKTNQLVAEAYLKNRGYEIVVAETGEEAIDYVENIDFKLIFMDCQLPHIDGYEATKRIRQRENQLGLHTPIIAMTANAMKEDREKCISVGMDDFLAKPLQPIELEKILLQWMSHQGNQFVDWGVLIKLSNDVGEKTVHDLISSYHETLRQSVEELSRFKSEGKIDAIRRTAHRLQSSSATLGAFHLARYCQNLEQKSAQTLNVEDVSSEIETLLTEAGQVEKTLSEQAGSVLTIHQAQHTQYLNQ